MNIFFYAGTADHLEHAYGEALRQRRCFSRMCILPGGSKFTSPSSLALRNGDLLLLCAASEQSLDDLLTLHRKFDDYRVVLILPKHDDMLIKKAHLLRPRYIISFDDDVEELEKVVQRMTLSRINDRLCRRNFPYIN